MSSTTSTPQDDAFRSYVIDFLCHVPPSALDISGTARSELEALAGEYYETSQDQKMQELLMALHARYDLAKLGFFEQRALNEIIVRINQVRYNVGAWPDSGSGKNTTATTPGAPQQAQMMPQHNLVTPDQVTGDLVGVGLKFPVDASMPVDLDTNNLGTAKKEVGKVRTQPEGEESYVVGWKTEFQMTPRGMALVYKQWRCHGGAGIGTGTGK
ncbi:uncharacterized protein Z519_09054 [Cladophialophora bantiana CBS 173.52]|uniref:Uncharacterized protein n=1 Tax=Cladophialophora bantiana (strain ATCC 10958 / CBS 173.52 / CDC B-1940 / NIH 8579) TaxID=1442370 RepID=A0A0D2I0M5_CLAB1|nr:uncharacterized protein Z519_09054 [Cladophialophora bantiana CBS 173.52]KIW90409.1 hypothetical protein Z519_09054 [Cladophialophora bantiana CBS 173.52]